MEQNAETDTPMTPVVDNNKQRSGNGLKIATAIACVAAVCGIGFGVYEMTQSLQKDSQISGLETKIKDFQESTASIEPSETVEPTESTTVTNIYKNFADNMANNNNSFIVFGDYYHWTGSTNERWSVMAEIKNAHLTITGLDGGEQGVIFADVDDVISVNYILIGNGNIPYMYFIKKDGSVARINISENSDRAIEHLDEYKEIVSIINVGNTSAQLVDISGNVYMDY